MEDCSGLMNFSCFLFFSFFLFYFLWLFVFLVGFPVCLSCLTYWFPLKFFFLFLFFPFVRLRSIATECCVDVECLGFVTRLYSFTTSNDLGTQLMYVGHVSPCTVCTYMYVCTFYIPVIFLEKFTMTKTGSRLCPFPDLRSADVCPPVAVWDLLLLATYP